MLLFALTACLFTSRSAVAPNASVEARIVYPKADRFYGLPESTLVDLARIRPEHDRTCFDLTRRFAIAPGVIEVGADEPDARRWRLVAGGVRVPAAEVRYGEPRRWSVESWVVSGFVAAGYCHEEVCVARDAAGNCLDTECVDRQAQGQVLREATTVDLRERDETVCFDRVLPDADVVELRHVTLLGRQRFLWQAR